MNPGPLAESLPPLTAGDAWRIWQLAPAASAILLLLAGGYLWGVHRVNRRRPAGRWPPSRALAFLSGLGVIAVATQSSVGVYDDVLFSAHMVQHVLLIMVAPPLLVFGRPVTLLLHAARNPVHTWVKRAVRSRLAAALTWPPGAAVLYAAVVVGTHTPPVMDLVLGSGAAHDAEHVLYLAAGYLYFLLIIGSEPVRWRVSMAGRYLLLLIGMQVDTVVGVVLMVVGHEIYPAYARADPVWGPGLLTDLHGGGMVMWIGSDIVMTVLAVAVAAGFVHHPRHSGHVGGWLEGIRRAALRREITAAGVLLPGGASAACTVDDDAHLAAYNAYLSAIGDARPRVQRATGGSPTGSNR